MFDTEQYLVESILKQFRDTGFDVAKYNKDNIEILTELKLGYGIPDIVIVNKKSQKPNNRITNLNSFDISILSIIKKEKKIDIDQLINVTKSQRTKLNHTISILVKEDIISNVGGKLKFKQYKSLISDCIAIEVKLKNWKRALHQAYRYKWFANQSYILLPEYNIAPALNNINLFKALNVGILSIDKNGKISKCFAPKYEEPISENMLFLLNESLVKI